MSQNKLVFLGLSSDECRTFIRDVHQRAHDVGRFRDNAWVADLAMSALDEDALQLFDELQQDTQDNWTLLRRELLRRYCSDNRAPTVSAKHFIIPTPPAVASFAPPAASPLPTAIQPSNHVYPYPQGGTPKFNIRVVAPKIRYSAFISKTFGTDGSGCRCSILTEEQPEALECKDMNEWDGGALSTTRGSLQLLVLHPTQADGMSATLTLMQAINMSDGENSLVTVRQDKTPWKDWEEATCLRWTVDRGGLLTPGDDASPKVAVIGKMPNGNLTLFFWKRRVWDEVDDAYAAELYFVRAS